MERMPPMGWWVFVFFKICGWVGGMNEVVGSMKGSIKEFNEQKENSCGEFEGGGFG